MKRMILIILLATPLIVNSGSKTDKAIPEYYEFTDCNGVKTRLHKSVNMKTKAYFNYVEWEFFSKFDKRKQ